MKKIIALSGTILLLWSCAGSLVNPAPSEQAPEPQEAPRQALLSQEAPFQLEPAAPDSASFAGRTSEEVFVAARIALGDCRYAVKSSDSDGGLLVATRTAGPAGEKNPPMATVLVFTDPVGAPGVKVQVVRPGQAGDPSGEIRSETGKILAAIQDLLR